MRININNWKVINNKLPTFALFCFLSCLYLGCIVNYWYFLLLIFIPFTFYKCEINTKQLIFLILMFLIFSILIIYLSWFGIVKITRGYMRSYVRKAMFKFFDKHYSKDVSSFIKLILFNVKTQDTIIFYKQTVDLGIVWLICISGFHISFLSRVITWCFKKIPNVGRYVNISIIFFYSYLLEFSYASIRVLLKIILTPHFNIFKTKEFDRIGIIGLLIIFPNPVCLKDYGFLLSFLICIGANCIAKLELNNKIISRILINILACLITLPFVISMNHKISLFTFINAFIFNNFSPFVFMYYLLFCLMPFMEVIHHGIMIGIFAIIGNISFSNVFIYFKQWDAYIIVIYYLLLFILLKIIYLIVLNNKI